MAQVSQLNVRLDSNVKAAGDSVLDLYGISATQVIRSLWDKLAHGEEALKQFAEMLAKSPAAGTAIHPIEEATDANDRYLSTFQTFTREMGLDPSTYVPLSDEELNDLVYQDYLEDCAKKVTRH